MPKLKQSASDKHQNSAYKSRFMKNQLAKLEKLAKEQPNNKQLQVRLEKAIDKAIPYTRNRKSNGHTCKGLYKELGFVKNQPSDLMKKSKLEIHWYMGNVLEYNYTIPNHGANMRSQLEMLGFKWGGYDKRKHKKTTR